MTTQKLRKPADCESSSQERAARLAAMENDASQADESKSKRLKAWNEVDAAEKAREQRSHTGEGKFLDDVQQQAFAGDGGSLEDNLGRRAHYRQGRADALS